MFVGPVAAAFSDEVLNKGENSTLLELADGHVAVVRVLEHEEEQIQSLEEVAASIEQLVKLQKARAILLEKGKGAVASLQNNSDLLKQLASDLNSEVVSAGAILRDDGSVESELLAKIFEIEIPSDGQPVINGFELNDGQYAIVRLNEVIETDDANTSLELSEWISLQGQYGRREMQSMLKSLRETGDVIIFTENL